MIIETKCCEVEVSFVKSLSSNQLQFLSQWITESGELPLISGNKQLYLSENELLSWIATSFQCSIVVFENEIIGFATLSNVEAEIPSNSLEICHCIIHPKYRRKYNGSALVTLLTANAKQNGFKKVVGRVISTNLVGFSLLKDLNWRPLLDNYSDESSVVWLEKSFI
jgi:hypothetical protein